MRLDLSISPKHDGMLRINGGEQELTVLNGNVAHLGEYGLFLIIPARE